MARIKILDLPADQQISSEEMKLVKGWITISFTSSINENLKMEMPTSNFSKTDIINRDPEFGISI